MKEILITGGTEGIGLALARVYMNRDVHLHLVARTPQKLLEIKNELEVCGGKVSIHVCDLRQMEQVHSLTKEVQDADICILNAGMGYTGAVVQSDSETNVDMVNLNVTGTMYLADYYVKQMVKRKDGLIILMSSTGSFQPGPYIALYYATKAFVTSYGRALAQELKNEHVHVCVVCPGPVNTSFYRKSGGIVPSYAISAEKIAEIVYQKAEKKTLLVIGRMNRILRVVPTGLKMWYVKRSKLEQISKED